MGGGGKRMADSSRACLSAIYDLQVLIKKQYQEGGWLPPGRQMARQLGVCHRTYSKALQILVGENLVISYHGKGYYVFPENLRPHKVGVVLRSGGDSPYIDEVTFIAQALLSLNRKNFFAHMIQAVRPQKIVESAIVHGVEGLLWFNPPQQALEYIHKVQETDKFPIMVVQTLYDTSPPRPLYEVAYDYEYGRRANTRAMLARGHRNIMYLGEYENICPQCNEDEMTVEDGVFRPENWCEDASKQPGWVTQRLLSGEISGIITPGNPCNMLTLFSEVAALPEAQRPEILAPENKAYYALYRQYPQLKIVMFRRELQENFGELAVNILTDYLVKGSPLRRVHVRYNSEEIVGFSDQQ